MSRYPYYEVQFLNERGDLVKKSFESLYKCRVFVIKCKHSKRVTLISYPLALDF